MALNFKCINYFTIHLKHYQITGNVNKQKDNAVNPSVMFYSILV